MTTYLIEKQVYLGWPWTLPLTIARTFLFLGTGLTLCLAPAWAVFTPSNGDGRTVHCDGVSAISVFCLAGNLPLELVTTMSGALLLAFATGLAPWATALPGAWILLSVPLSGTLIDGGDQLAGILGVLLLPVNLTDRRWNPWATSVMRITVRPTTVLIATMSWWLARAQIVVVYLEACIGKVAISDWSNGTALYAWERHPNFGAPGWAQPLVYWLTSQPVLTAILTFAVMATEFAVAISLVLPRVFRIGVLYPTAAAMHLGIIVFMGVSSFSMVMIAALTLLVLPMDTDVPLLSRRGSRSRARIADEDQHRTHSQEEPRALIP